MDATLDFIEARGRRQGEAIGRVEGEAIGKVKGEEIGRVKGEEIGRVKGEARGITKVNQLILFLTRDKRIEDIIKSAEDMEYQKKLFIEYGLEKAPQS